MPEFGTSGLRGLSVELTDELCATYAAAFAALHGAGRPVFIGQDKRDSSPRIVEAVARGINAEGLRVVSCGVLPTPALAMAAAEAEAAAVMVTGSHIPADRNGLKFYTSAGEFTKADEAPLIEEVARRAVPQTTSPPVIDAGSAREDYINRYTHGLKGRPLTGLRVGFWEHSSAADVALPAIVSGLGAEVVTLGQSDVFVPVDTEAVDGATRDLLAGWVAEHRLDAIVSTDGDADRPLLADQTGSVVPGDILGPITARWLGADRVVTTVSANTLVDLMNVFPSVERTKIGSPYVIAAMERGMAEGAKIVGYEPNGGFLLGWDVTDEDCTLARLVTRDAVLPMVATLATAAAAGDSVSAVLADYPSRRTATDRLQDIPRDRSLRLVEALLSGDLSVMPSGVGALVSTDTTDGARLMFDSGRIVSVRPSGNAPELRCYVEAESSDVARVLLSEALDNLRRALG